MEGIREQLVKKPKEKDDTIKKGLVLMVSLLLAVLAAAGISALTSGLMAGLGMLLGLGILVGGWWFAGSFNVEYEYTVVEGELQIDKILNKRSRKALCAVKLRSAEGFYSSEKHIQNATEVNACGEGQRYSIEYNDPKYGKTVIIFTPDERTLNAVKPYLPRMI